MEGVLARSDSSSEDVALQAVKPMIDWARTAPSGDLATELMAAFGPDGRGAERDYVVVDDFLTCLFRGYPGQTEDTFKNKFKAAEVRARAQRLLVIPLAEAVQLLDHAELVRDAFEGELGRWHATRFGLATLAQGKAAVRQRIKDRTGL
jgi:hypothetical protein